MAHSTNRGDISQQNRYIDIEVCESCGAQVKVIEQILNHLKPKAGKVNAAKQHELPPERAPPRATSSLFDPS